MSPLARSLLALAAAALLHAAAAEQCSTIFRGSNGHMEVLVLRTETDQTDSVHKLGGCPPYTLEVGVTATACDPYGSAPRLELLDSQRLRVTCTWTEGQTCPHHLTVEAYKYCDIL